MMNRLSPGNARNIQDHMHQRPCTMCNSMNPFLNQMNKHPCLFSRVWSNLYKSLFRQALRPVLHAAALFAVSASISEPIEVDADTAAAWTQSHFKTWHAGRSACMDLHADTVHLDPCTRSCPHVNDECTCIKKQHSIEDRSELTLMDTFAGQPGLLKEVKKL